MRANFTTEAKEFMKASETQVCKQDTAGYGANNFSPLNLVA